MTAQPQATTDEIAARALTNDALAERVQKIADFPRSFGREQRAALLTEAAPPALARRLRPERGQDMIAPWTEVQINHTRYRVEGFTRTGDTLWVELEETSGGWPTQTAMITFAELAPIVAAQEADAARDAYEQQKRTELGIEHYGMSSKPPEPLPDGFWDDYTGPHADAAVVVLTVPPGKAQAVLAILAE
jgi:hypothetical protein